MQSTQIEWISKKDAAARLSLSARRVLELAQEGRIESAKVRDPKTGQHIVRVHAGSVERYLDQRAEIPQPDPAREPHAERMLPGDSHAIRTPAREPHATRTLAALLELLSHANRTRTARLWLTVAEAADFSGLPAGMVLQLVLTRQLPAMDVGRRRGGRWRIRRVDLERLEGQLLELPPAAV